MIELPPKTAIYIRQLHADLTPHCLELLAGLAAPKLLLFGHNDNLGYFQKMYELAAEQGHDWVVNIDEDAFVAKPERLAGLVGFMVANAFTIAGQSDQQAPRMMLGPHMVNAYFNVINMAAIRCLGDWDEIMRRGQEYPHDISKNEFSEPYYRFYAGVLALGGWFHYLQGPYVQLDYVPSCRSPDPYRWIERRMVTALCDQHDQPFLLHSWYGRGWGGEPYHRERILQTRLAADRWRQGESLKLLPALNDPDDTTEPVLARIAAMRAEAEAAKTQTGG